MRGEFSGPVGIINDESKLIIKPSTSPELDALCNIEFDAEKIPVVSNPLIQPNLFAFKDPYKRLCKSPSVPLPNGRLNQTVCIKLFHFNPYKNSLDRFFILCYKILVIKLATGKPASMDTT